LRFSCSDIRAQSDALMYDPFMKNAVSSIKVGAGCKVTLCDNEACSFWDLDWPSASVLVGPYSSAQLINNRINDAINTIRVSPYDPKTEFAVQTFAEADFDAGHAGLLPPGEYPANKLTINGRVDNGNGFYGSLSSMRIPKELAVYLYTEDYFKANSTVLMGPRDITFNRELMHLNDKVKSVRVVRIDQVKASA
jgi:hypothetical protein